MSLCFLFLIWTVSRNFSTPMLLRLFVIFLGRISHLRFFVFSCFLFFKNRSFFAPQGNWAPGVGSKVERSTELAIWTRWKFCPFVFCCHFERSAKFFRVFSFYLTAHPDSFLITVVYSEFPCFLAFSSVKNGSFDQTQETQTFENWNKISTLYRLS